jgi:hypothetical protein
MYKGLIALAALAVVGASDMEAFSALETSSTTSQAEPVFATIVDQNMEVTGRVFESCNRGDMNARWASGNKHCYMLFNTEKTWFQARRACENIGGHLVTITYEDEMSFIWSQFGKQFQGNKFTWKGPWIGYSDSVDEGRWQWINGETGVVGQDSVYSNWYEGEPDNCCGGEDCAHIAGGHWGNKWNDNKCHFNYAYICEKEW